MFFLGIDLGASGLKLCLLDDVLQTIVTFTRPLATSHPHTGWAEQNPLDWRAALFEALHDMARDYPQEAKRMAGIGFSGGAHIAVLTDGAGVPLRPAILWSDQRATRQADYLRAHHSVLAHSLNQANPGWTLPQLIWLQENEPTLWARVEKIYFAKDWLRAQISAIDTHSSDFGEAIGALMGDYATQNWAAELMDFAGVHPTHLPDLHKAMHVAGYLNAHITSMLGVDHSIPLFQGSIDTSIEWLCCGASAKGSASLKLASAGVVALSDDTAHCFPPVSCYPHIIAGLYYHAAGMNQCTSALGWLGRVFLNDMPVEEMDALAQTAPRGAHGVLFHPYLNGERAPHWNGAYRAHISQLSRASDRADIARAGFEGLSFAFYDIVQDMRKKCGVPLKTLHLLGGGGASAFWAQMLADMLNAEIRLGQNGDASFGAALLAAAAVQKQDLNHMAAKAYRAKARFMPDAQAHKFYHTQFAQFDKMRYEFHHK